MHELFEVNAFCISNNLGGQEAVVHSSILQLRADLFDWYADQARAGRSPNEVQDFSAAMYHGPGHDLGLHAAETNTFLEFVVNSLLENMVIGCPRVFSAL